MIKVMTKVAVMRMSIKMTKVGMMVKATRVCLLVLVLHHGRHILSFLRFGGVCPWPLMYVREGYGVVRSFLYRKFSVCLNDHDRGVSWSLLTVMANLL